MRDPLDELKNLTAGTAGPTLPAAEVRRRGDRMRRRRTATQALGAAAAVAVIASGGALAAGVTSTAPRPVDPAAPTSSADPSPSPTPSPTRVATSEIPQDFPIWEGIEPTKALEDVMPEATGSMDLDDEKEQSWYGLPCTPPGEKVAFPGDDRRTAALRVWLEGDFGAKSRQVLVYEDYAAADRAFTGLGTSLTACAKSGETPPGAQPMDWSVEDMPGNEDTPSWVIAQGSSTGDGSHAFFVDLTATQVGRSVIVSWSGRDQKERLSWQRLEDSHDVVLRAAWCLWMEGPCGEQPEPVESAQTPEPADFDKRVLTRGLPEPGGDVPQWTWSETTAAPLSAVACGEARPLPATPRSALRVQVSPPDAQAWRHAMVFDDVATADAVYAGAREAVGRCSEGQQGVPEHELGPSETRWSFEESTRGAAALLEIEGLAYARGTDVRVPGRTLTTLVQVGNAVLVARMDDASSVDGEDAAAEAFHADVAYLTARMCRMAGASCR
jgi:hypothetical protein